MKPVFHLGLAMLFLWCAVPVGAQPMDASPMMHPPAFLDHVFRPELIMRYQREIGLTSAQQEAITRAMAETQQALVDLRWKFEAESQELAKLLDSESVNEGAALAMAEKVMSIEQQIKKEHLRMLIRIKNELTPEQQAKLRQLEPGERRRRRGRE
jgi:Spy/CpxP family protein refolding chaperone